MDWLIRYLCKGEVEPNKVGILAERTEPKVSRSPVRQRLASLERCTSCLAPWLSFPSVSLAVLIRISPHQSQASPPHSGKRTYFPGWETVRGEHFHTPRSCNGAQPKACENMFTGGKQRRMLLRYPWPKGCLETVRLQNLEMKRQHLLLLIWSKHTESFVFVDQWSRVRDVWHKPTGCANWAFVIR